MKRAILIVSVFLGCGVGTNLPTETDQEAIDEAAVSFYPESATVPGNDVWSMVELSAADPRVAMSVAVDDAHFVLADGSLEAFDDATAIEHNAYIRVLQPDEIAPATGHAAAQSVTSVLSVTFTGTPTLTTSDGTVLLGHPVHQTYRLNDGVCDPFVSSGCP